MVSLAELRHFYFTPQFLLCFVADMLAHCTAMEGCRTGIPMYQRRPLPLVPAGAARGVFHPDSPVTSRRKRDFRVMVRLAICPVSGFAPTGNLESM